MICEIIENAYLEELGIETNEKDKGFLKGALAAGTLAALFGSPEAAEHTKEAIASAADNVGDFFHNVVGHGHGGSGHSSGYFNDVKQQELNLFKQGYQYDPGTGYLYNPNAPEGKKWWTNGRFINLDNIINNQTDLLNKTKHPFLYGISPGLASTAETINNHPLATAFGTTAVGAGMYAGGRKLSKILKGK